MLREHVRLVAISLYITDIVLTVASFVAAYGIRAYMLEGYNLKALYSFNIYLWVIPVIVVLWSILLRYFKVYKPYRTVSTLVEVKLICKSVLVGGVVIGAVAFLVSEHYLSRSLIFIFIAVNMSVLTVERLVIRSFSHYVRKRGYNYSNVLIVGTNDHGVNILKVLEANKDWGIKVLGFITEDPGGVNSEFQGYKVLGSIGDIERIVSDEIVDEVVFASPGKDMSRLEDIFLLLEDYGISARMAMDIFPHAIARIKVEDLGSIPLLSFTTIPTNTLALVVKRVFDVVFSLSLLIATSPVLLLTAVLIRATSKGGALFRQERSGKNGRVFTIYKFRSMVVDAEEVRARSLEDKNEMDGPVFMILNDPRVTRIGRFIRKVSIDELPQLWNVLKGDMSMIGPRPPLPSEVAKYKRWQRRRLSMKPGIVCLWQVSGNYLVKDFDEWVRLDLEYIDRWSLKLDMKIFFKTIPTVLFGRGEPKGVDK